ncbi:ribonuclease D [Synoicihabitans lomoniglobus]|uniref:HRDC domain-containing protein n=1 Tax=Synoicihabitans lomoniglobus TaxID=2909285 RepID=A0AAE9ZXR5_9BACT|nr:HRDC domain-containing protein [Opitutaceae bacterium LMO-M01]WED64508.1 HRDC domain-containing protein [Opitutaceae bacterium LMO-M01]
MIKRFLPRPARRLLGVKVKPEPPAYELLDQPGSLQPLLDALDTVDEVAVDTEADNMNCYRTKICLLQFLVNGRVFLVDALAPMNFDALYAKLATKHLLMHGSDFDLRLFHDLNGFEAKSMFDTMLAAQLLNRQRVGLAALMEDYFGFIMSKESQKANWSRRPLTKKLLDYASLDVWHLPELRDLLNKELVKLKRTDWLDQQCRRQIESAQTGFPGGDENAWRIGKSEKLRGRGLAVLHAVWHWREKTAERLDTPPFKVCNNSLLIKMGQAAEAGDTPAAVLGTINLGRRHSRLIASLTKAVHQGFETDPETLPRRKRNRDNRSLVPKELAFQDRLKAGRDVLATKLNLDATLIANRAQLAAIARSPDELDSLLLPWQAGLIREIPAFAQGIDGNGAA